MSTRVKSKAIFVNNAYVNGTNETVEIVRATNTQEPTKFRDYSLSNIGVAANVNSAPVGIISIRPETAESNASDAAMFRYYVLYDLTPYLTSFTGLTINACYLWHYQAAATWYIFINGKVDTSTYSEATGVRFISNDYASTSSTESIAFNEQYTTVSNVTSYSWLYINQQGIYFSSTSFGDDKNITFAEYFADNDGAFSIAHKLENSVYLGDDVKGTLMNNGIQSPIEYSYDMTDFCNGYYFDGTLSTLKMYNKAYDPIEFKFTIKGSPLANIYANEGTVIFQSDYVKSIPYKQYYISDSSSSTARKFWTISSEGVKLWSSATQGQSMNVSIYFYQPYNSIIYVGYINASDFNGLRFTTVGDKINITGTVSDELVQYPAQMALDIGNNATLQYRLEGPHVNLQIPYVPIKFDSESTAITTIESGGGGGGGGSQWVDFSTNIDPDTNNLFLKIDETNQIIYLSFILPFEYVASRTDYTYQLPISFVPAGIYLATQIDRYYLSGVTSQQIPHTVATVYKSTSDGTLLQTWINPQTGVVHITFSNSNPPTASFHACCGPIFIPYISYQLIEQ